MAKSLLIVLFLAVLLFFLSISSGIYVENNGVEEDQEYIYESSQNGFWPMPGANLANTGYSDMGAIDFTDTPTATLKNDEGITRTPPVMDVDGYVYTIHKTNTSKNSYICTIECYDPKHPDAWLWSRTLVDYPVDGPCEYATLVLSSRDILTALVDGRLYNFRLLANHSEPANTLPIMLEYHSTILIPISESLFLVDDIETSQLHLISVFTNCTNCTNNNDTMMDWEDELVDYNTDLVATTHTTPALHALDTGYGADPTPDIIFSVNVHNLTAYNILSRSTSWTVNLGDQEEFWSNVVVTQKLHTKLSNELTNGTVFVLVSSSGEIPHIYLRGYYYENGENIFNVSIYTPGGAEKSLGRLSVDEANHRVLAMFEDAPGNNTIITSFDFTTGMVNQTNLGEANFQGPMSIDFEGKYYVITSQMNGYVALRSSDLGVQQRLLSDDQNPSGISRNYAAIGNGTMVISGSGGVYALSQPGGDGGGKDHTWIILLAVFGGVVFIVFLLALAGLIYHYYTKNRRQGYEVV